MKKIKLFSILSILLLGFFINQSFGYEEKLYIDTVTPSGNGSYVSDGISSTYQYTFKNNYGSVYGYFVFDRYQKGRPSITMDFPGFGEGQSTRCPASLLSGVFSSSLYNFVPYNPTCVSQWQNGITVFYYALKNYDVSHGEDGLGSPIVYLGLNNSFGNNFISINNNGQGTVPYYGLGNGFYNSNGTYLSVPLSESNYFRLFFPAKEISENTYSNPVDTFNLTGMDSEDQTGSTSRMYFYPHGTRTNYGYIVDDGSLYTKYTHFGGYLMGYSYIYGRVPDTATEIYRNQLGFRTVSDAIQIALMVGGDVSYNELTNRYSDSINLSYDGILLLRANSYVPFNNDNGTYLLSKDPTNYKRMLYEHRSCNTSNIDLLISNSTGCVKLDGGYLTYNGSTEVFNFSAVTGMSLASLDPNYPLLFDLLAGHRSLFTMAGINELGSNCIKFNDSSRCYGFQSNQTVDILENYLNPGYESSGQVNMDILTLCLNNSNFYDQNIYLCENMLGTIGQPVEIPGMTGCYISYTVNDSGNIVTWVTCQDDFNNTGYNWVDNGSGGYYVCTNPAGCDVITINTGINSDGSGFNESSLGSLSVWFSDYFKNGFFFKCPFHYGSNGFVGLTSYGIKNFYKKLGESFLYPIYCMSAGFQAGKDTNVLGSVSQVLPSRLLNSNDYEGLYNLFDLILSIGILFFVYKIYNLTK